jgi:hypothetical protein
MNRLTRAVSGVPAVFAYSAFGLPIRSEVPLVELQNDGNTGAQPHSVEIVTGAVEDLGGEESNFQIGLDVTIVSQPDVARYGVEGGARILIDAQPGSDLQHLKFYLYTQALPSLLYQRRKIPLHASAIEKDGRIAVFVGHSGAGKSSLAAMIAAKGASLISDDILTFRTMGDGTVGVDAGISRLHLSDAVAPRAGFQLPAPSARFGARGKHYYRVATLPMEGRLAAIYFLDWEDVPTIEPVDPFQSLMKLRDNAYFHMQIKLLAIESDFMKSYSQIVAQVPCYRYARKRDLDRIEDQAAAIVDHLAGLSH